MYNPANIETLSGEVIGLEQTVPMKRMNQGIGLSLLIGSKLIVMLQGYSAVAMGSAGALPPTQFSPGRMLTSMAIAVIASLLLTLFWTLDDLGARPEARFFKVARLFPGTNRRRSH